MISVKYGGNSIYPPSLIMTTFNVKQPTWIKVAKMSDVTYGSTVKVVGRLLYNGTTALKYKTVYVTVNDDVYYCKSDGAGYIRLEYTIDNYETQKIIFEYDGSSLYMASRNSTSFKVKTEEKQYTYIKLNNIPEVAYGDTVTISGYYYYGNNIPLTYTPMTLNINGEIFTVKTDAKGFFTYNYKTDRVWKNTLNVSYHGNTRFMAASATATFNVKITSPIETYITLNNIREVKCGEYTTISGYYYYSKDIPLTSTSMTININGQKYYAKTDNTGYFVLSYKTSKVGKNTVTVSYQGNSNFKAATKSATFQVKS